MDNSLIKMKHGGGISLNGQDIQIPLLQGVFAWAWANSGQLLKGFYLLVFSGMP